MNFSTTMRIVVAVAALLFLPTGISLASPPSQFDITFDFPDQGLAINSEEQVHLKISNGLAWQSGAIEMALSAVTFVAPNSKADNVKINHTVKFGAGDGNGMVTIPLTITSNGEKGLQSLRWHCTHLI